MSTHRAEIVWSRDDQPFVDNRYSRRHLLRFDGGAEVVASSSPQVVPVPMSDPAAVDPEEAFVAALSSCHMLWFLSIAARGGFCVDRYVDAAEGRMSTNAQGKLAITEVRLRPAVTFSGASVPSDAQIAQMHEEAHEACFIANSVCSRVLCEPVLNAP